MKASLKFLIQKFFELQFSTVLITSFLLASGQSLAFASSPDDHAVSLYEAGRFEEAALVYDSLLALDPENAYLLYNRGNCAFKSGHLGQAISFYLEARRRKPFDRDIRHNLEYALSLTQDEIPLQEPFFILRWLGDVATLLKPRVGWTISLILSILGTAGMALYAFSFHTPWRRRGFFLGLSCFIFSLLIVLPFWVHAAQNKRKTAVVTVPVCDVSSEPAPSAPKLFVLHEGAVAQVKDSTSQYYQIVIDSRRQGWVLRSSVWTF